MGTETLDEGSGCLGTISGAESMSFCFTHHMETVPLKLVKLWVFTWWFSREAGGAEGVSCFLDRFLGVNFMDGTLTGVLGVVDRLIESHLESLCSGAVGQVHSSTVFN